MTTTTTTTPSASATEALADLVATTVIRAFTALPRKYQPREREWVPLSGVVLEDECGEMFCAALGTGMKVLPENKVPLAKGWVLHDCHAEVIAIRGFNCFLIEECRKLSHSKDSESYVSAYVQRSTSISPAQPQPFEIRPSIKIHFYSSEAPCGDCSMELLIASAADPTPWVPTVPAVPTPSTPTTISSTLTSTAVPPHLRGRGYFSSLGAVRTKPGRADSPPTHSKSCSDKLSLRCCISLLLTPASLLLSPARAYIDTLVLPLAAYSTSGCARAFGAAETGRMAPLLGREWGGGYKFAPFEVATTTREFAFSRRAGAGPNACNLVAVKVAGRGEEVLIGGVLQGRKAFGGDVVGDREREKAGSMLCKARIWRAVVEVGVLLGAGAAGVLVNGGSGSYAQLKSASPERAVVKRDVRTALGAWIRTGGDDFSLPPLTPAT